MKITDARRIGWDVALRDAAKGRPRKLADLVADGKAPPTPEHAQRMAAFIRGTASSTKDTPLSLESTFMIRDRASVYRCMRADLQEQLGRRGLSSAERARLRAEARRYTVAALLAEFHGKRMLDAHGRVVTLTRARARDLLYGRS